MKLVGAKKIEELTKKLDQFKAEKPKELEKELIKIGNEWKRQLGLFTPIQQKVEQKQLQPVFA